MSEARPAAESSSALRRVQYRTPDALEARIALHARFSTNRQGFGPWLFEQLEVPDDARILELGCGQGNFWSGVLERVPRGWALRLSDFSPGMVRATRNVFSSAPDLHARFACLDACAIVFGGSANDYQCSTNAVTIDRSAYVSGWGDGQYCTNPVAEDFSLEDPNQPGYDCGVAMCSYSAYVEDHGCQSVNYCW